MIEEKQVAVALAVFATLEAALNQIKGEGDHLLGLSFLVPEEVVRLTVQRGWTEGWSGAPTLSDSGWEHLRQLLYAEGE